MIKTIWRRLTLSLPLVPVGCALIATALFFSQGGFGGGHGDADFAIGVLGLPSVALLERGLPIPHILESSDLLMIIWYPALLNSLFFWCPLACFISLVGRLLRKR
ncbi:hypothetical protein V5E97_24395 [Singulisphaera sp. Ch08]|uniref:Uncharacterized protein n=1 Tax=Singulisphaera sp. Ch08 TaxID=3120278 RepID=A0AAU7C8P0_9BACT